MRTGAARIALRPPTADPSHLVPTARGEPVARWLAALSPDRLQPVLDEADAYTAQLDLLGLTDRDVVPGNTQPRRQQRLTRSATAIVAPFPLTWLGWGLLARRRLRHPWRAALVAGPLGAYAALACWEQLDWVRHGVPASAISPSVVPGPWPHPAGAATPGPPVPP